MVQPRTVDFLRVTQASALNQLAHSIGYADIDFGFEGGLWAPGNRSAQRLPWVEEGHRIASPAAAAEATITAWRDMEADPDGLIVNVPLEVEAAIQVLGPIPWLTARDK
jgi:hypothetical protein